MVRSQYFAAGPLQQAIYDALSTALDGTDIGVYDDVPPDAEPPWVKFGDHDYTFGGPTKDKKTKGGSEEERWRWQGGPILRIYSRGSRKEAIEAADRVFGALPESVEQDGWHHKLERVRPVNVRDMSTEDKDLYVVRASCIYQSDET